MKITIEIESVSDAKEARLALVALATGNGNEPETKPVKKEKPVAVKPAEKIKLVEKAVEPEVKKVSPEVTEEVMEEAQEENIVKTMIEDQEKESVEPEAGKKILTDVEDAIEKGREWIINTLKAEGVSIGVRQGTKALAKKVIKLGIVVDIPSDEVPEEGAGEIVIPEDVEEEIAEKKVEKEGHPEPPAEKKLVTADTTRESVHEALKSFYADYSPESAIGFLKFVGGQGVSNLSALPEAKYGEMMLILNQAANQIETMKKENPNETAADIAETVFNEFQARRGN